MLLLISFADSDQIMLLELMCLRLGLKDQDIAYKLEKLLTTISRIISIMDKFFIYKVILEEAW